MYTAFYRHVLTTCSFLNSNNTKQQQKHWNCQIDLHK